MFVWRVKQTDHQFNYLHMSQNQGSLFGVTFVLPIYKPGTSQQLSHTFQSDRKMSEVEIQSPSPTKSIRNSGVNFLKGPLSNLKDIELKRAIVTDENLSRTSQLNKVAKRTFEDEQLNLLREFWKNFERFESRRVNQHESFEKLLSKESISIEVFWLLVQTRYFEDKSALLGKSEKVIIRNLEDVLNRKEEGKRGNFTEEKSGHLVRRVSESDLFGNCSDGQINGHLLNRGSLAQFHRTCTQWVKRLIKLNSCLLDHGGYHGWLLNRLLLNLNRKSSGMSFEEFESDSLPKTFKSPKVSELLLSLKDKRLLNWQRLERLQILAEQNKTRLFSNNFTGLLAEAESRFQLFSPSKEAMITSFPRILELNLEHKFLEELHFKKQQELQNDSTSKSIFFQSSPDICQVCNSGDSIEDNKLVYCSVA